MMMYDILVIGGGVIGCSIAYHLAKKGHRIAIVERGELGQEASSAAGGMLGSQNEFDEEHPLFPLAQKSRQMYPNLQAELKELTGIDIELVQEGLLKMASSSKDLEAIHRQYQFLSSRNPHITWCERDDLLQMETNLSEEVEAGIYIPEDGQVSAPKLSKALATACKKMSVSIYERTEAIDMIIQNEKVVGVKTNHHELFGHQTIIASGAWSNQLLKKTGRSIPMIPVKGECYSVICDQPLIRKTLFNVNGCYIVPKSENRLLIGATSTPHCDQHHVSVAGLHSLIIQATAMLPKIKESTFERAWAGIRPQTGDGMPYMGEHPELENLYICTGHYRNGILLTPITGKLFSDYITGNREASERLKPFSLDRSFVGGEIN
ncbi:glycine oxidase [Oikeobacillus pervagus]|uniref:glycine oxidase n=2 Tax=Oikeobacillus pervagus TaxID=1325931 RepID=A0AAJ1T411_9BACI|nr:glycine oxidase [Oikeobacillus pervagus]